MPTLRRTYGRLESQTAKSVLCFKLLPRRSPALAAALQKSEIGNWQSAMDRLVTSGMSLYLSNYAVRNKMNLQRWIKRLGFWGFLFFLIKGLLWLTVPALIWLFAQ